MWFHCIHRNILESLLSVMITNITNTIAHIYWNICISKIGTAY